MLLDFESFARDHGGIRDTTSPREWVRDIWGTWLDEVFPPLENVQSTGSLPAGLEENRLSQDKIQDLDKVDVSEVLDEGLTIANLKLEVAKLTQTLTERGNHGAFDLCRRGALYIKLGYLNQALEDLNAVRLFFFFFCLLLVIHAKVNITNTVAHKILFSVCSLWFISEIINQTRTEHSTNAT